MNIKKITSIITFGLFLTTASLIIPLEKVQAAPQSQITRSQAEQRALNMINLQWTYNSSKNSNISSQYAPYVTQPKQLNNFTTIQAKGIPYNWGGLDGLDSKSYYAPWSNFIDAVNKGAYVGNVNTDAGYGLIPGTAGIDCSGFVQATFNINDSKLSTSTMFNTYFTKINLSDIKHMDILDRPGDHVVIFNKWGTLNSLNGAFTYESTPDQTNGGIQGTKEYFISMAEINKGYIPGRYVNIAEDVILPHPVEKGIFAKISSSNSTVSIKANSSTDSLVIGTIPNGTILYMSDYLAGFYKVSYNGKSGWVYGDSIASIESGKYVTITGATQLNIRSNPSATSSIVGVLSHYQYAEVLGYSSDGKWFKIKINGIEGWSNKTYLSYIY